MLCRTLGGEWRCMESGFVKCSIVGAGLDRRRTRPFDLGWRKLAIGVTQVEIIYQVTCYMLER